MKPPVPFNPPATPQPPLPPRPPESLSSVTPQDGKSLAIAGLILAFTGTGLVGIILSIIAFKKSQKSSKAHTIATVGIIVNSIMLFIGTLVIVFLTIVAWSGVSAKAHTDLSKTSVNSLIASVDTYVTTNKLLPKTKSDLQLSNGISLTTLTTAPKDPMAVEFAYCDEGAIARFGYWDYQNNNPVYSYADSDGGTTKSTNCTIVQ